MKSHADILDQIKSKMSVSRMNIALAKDFILNNFHAEPKQTLFKNFIRKLNVSPIEIVNTDEESVLDQQIQQVAVFISWRLAFCEAIWGLIGQGLILPVNFHLDSFSVNVRYKSRDGSGPLGPVGSEVFVPNKIGLAPSLERDGDSTLFDSDLFIFDINIPNLHPEIEESLRSAIQCYRYELLLPSVAMLARASEGAWIETGLALIEYNQDGKHLQTKEKEKVKGILRSYDSITSKMNSIQKTFERKDIFKDLYAASRTPTHLREVLNWSYILRDYRNAIHYDNESASKITFDKVGTLLLAAGPRLKTLYDIRNAVS